MQYRSAHFGSDTLRTMTAALNEGWADAQNIFAGLSPSPAARISSIRIGLCDRDLARLGLLRFGETLRFRLSRCSANRWQVVYPKRAVAETAHRTGPCQFPLPLVAIEIGQSALLRLAPRCGGPCKPAWKRIE